MGGTAPAPDPTVAAAAVIPPPIAAPADPPRPPRPEAIFNPTAPVAGCVAGKCGDKPCSRDSKRANDERNCCSSTSSDKASTLRLTEWLAPLPTVLVLVAEPV